MATPRLRMDRSKVYSTIHGERTPGDPHAGIHFYQDGLPFDAQGFYVDGKLNDNNDPEGKLRALVERRLRKLEGKSLPADADVEAQDEIAAALVPGNKGGGDEVNLEAWARGESQYIFAEVRAAIRKRYSQVIKDTKGAIEALIDEKVVTEDDLAPAYKQLLGVAA